MTLFIEKTLNFNLFLQSITKHKLALDQYYVHLMRQNNVDKLSSIHMYVFYFFLKFSSGFFFVTGQLIVALGWYVSLLSTCNNMFLLGYFVI